MNDTEIDEAEQRIGLHRDTLTERRDALVLALANAQEAIHLSFCQAGDASGNKTCWKECREARAALLTAREEAAR